jgi:low affinity Fe/Cu permease
MLSWTVNMHDLFHKLAVKVSNIVGSPRAFALAFLLIIAWAVSGPLFGFSNTWQLMINTATTISTFLMVFLIQNTQNRDARAMHLKLDELIKAIKGASDNLIDVEEYSDRELDELQEQFRLIHQKIVNRQSRVIAKKK